jgi:RNA 3'-terminal phosphate cyclase
LYALELDEGRRHNEELAALHAPPVPEEPEPEPEPVDVLDVRTSIHASAASSSLLSAAHDDDTIVIPQPPRRRTSPDQKSKTDSAADLNLHSFVLSSTSPDGASPARYTAPVIPDPTSRILEKIPLEGSFSIDASMHGAHKSRLPLTISVTLAILFRASLRLSHIRAHEEAGSLTLGDANFLEWIARVYPRDYQNCVIGASTIRIDRVPWTTFHAGSYAFKLDAGDHIFPTLSTIFPLFIFGQTRMELAIIGVSDREDYPVLDHAERTLMYLCEKAGAQLSVTHEKRSLMPDGATTVVISTRSLSQYLRALDLIDRGNVTKVRVQAVFGHKTMRSTGHVILERMKEIAAERYHRLKLPCEWSSQWLKADGMYFGVIFSLECSNGEVVHESSFRNQRGFHSPMQVADDAMEVLAQFLVTPYSVDAHAQLPALMLMALAKGRSRIRTTALHADSVLAIKYLECVAGVRFDIRRGVVVPQNHARFRDPMLDARLRWEDTVLIECDGCGLENMFMHT